MATFDRRVTGKWLSSDFWLPVYKFAPLVLLLTALLPRLAALDRYVTPDEPSWVYRTLRFREALLAAEWASTLQSGHPGVTTTWLGSLAIQLQLWLQPDSRAHLEWISKLHWLAPDNGVAIQHLAQFMNAARLSVILVSSLGVVVIYLLARGRLGPLPALFGGFFLALDPFLGGLSGLFHVDALLATFMVMTILLLMPKREPDQLPKSGKTPAIARKYWVLAGITTALAILTKSPGLFLLLVVPAIWLWQLLKFEKSRPWYQPLGLWAVSLVLLLLLLLPALWADPGHTFVTISGLAERLLADAVRPAYFLGEVTLQPGSTFYPLAILYRLSPVVTLGLLMALIGMGYGLFKNYYSFTPVTVWWLLFFSLAFTIFLNFSAKRYDRYALPAIYALILVAGWGLATLIRHLYSLGQHKRLALLLIFFLSLAAVHFITAWPYPLTAYNWLLGGPASAQKVLPVGWGEGSGAAARWAATLPNSENQTLFSTNLPATAPFYPGRLLKIDRQNLSRIQPGDKVIYDASDWQSDSASFVFNSDGEPIIPKSLSEWPTLATFHFNGLPRSVLLLAGDPDDVAVEPLFDQPVDLSFNHNLQVTRATILPAASPHQVQVVIDWLISHAEDHQLRLELLDKSGHVWVSQEQLLLNEVDHSARFWPPGQIQQSDYIMTIPADLPPDQYTLAASLFDQQGARLGVFDSAGYFRGSAAQVAELEFEAVKEQPPIAIPWPVESDSELAGHGDLPDRIGAGEPLTLDLWWQSGQPSPANAHLALLLDSNVIHSDTSLPAGYPGQTYHIRPRWRLPADLVPGSYSLAIQLMDDNQEALWDEPVLLSQIEVESRDRRFELPSEVEPLQIHLGEIAVLQQALANYEDDQVEVRVIWQAAQPDGQNYVAFIHLVDEDGNIVAQVDRSPAEPTGFWLTGQVIDELFHLPAPEAGHYIVAIGLYEASSGRRLPVFMADGLPLADDSYRIELTVP